MTGIEKRLLANQAAIMCALSGLIANLDGVSQEKRTESQEGLESIAAETLKEIGLTQDQIDYIFTEDR